MFKTLSQQYFFLNAYLYVIFFIFSIPLIHIWLWDWGWDFGIRELFYNFFVMMGKANEKKNSIYANANIVWWKIYLPQSSSMMHTSEDRPNCSQMSGVAEKFAENRESCCVHLNFVATSIYVCTRLFQMYNICSFRL